MTAQYFNKQWKFPWFTLLVYSCVALCIAARLSVSVRPTAQTQQYRSVQNLFKTIRHSMTGFFLQCVS